MALAIAAVFLGLQARSSPTTTYALSITVNSLADTAHVADNADGGGTAGDAVRNGTETIPTVCGTTGTPAAPTGPCTLRAAVYMANANGDTADTITFDASLSGTITLGALTLPLGDCGSILAASCGANLVVNATTIDGPTASPDPTITVDCGGGATTAFDVTGASNTIRDLNIVGCSVAAIRITGEPADSNSVRGNYIGTNAGGTACSANGDGIAIVDGDSNTIGGSAAADRNVISCNPDDGVDISGAATANIVRNNFIGSDDLGGGAGTLGNGDNGIEDTSSSNTDIIDNVIVSNGGLGPNDDGIRLEGTTGAEVTGNKIGVAADGITPLGNVDDGVSSSGGGSHTIGGSRSGTGCASPCNIIAFNSDDGVQLSNSNGNTVAGNYIGTDASGNDDAGNGDDGVFVRGSSSGNTIGGSRPASTQCAGPCNVIVGNSSDGVFLNNSATNNAVRGNNIGVGADGLFGQPNGSDGVEDSSNNGAATGNRVGGTGVSPTTAGFCGGDCNIIANNVSAGVAVGMIADSRTSIRGNRMYQNGTLGIDLDNNAAVDCAGPTANGGIPCPDITSVVFTGGLFRVSGSCTNPGAPIDIYQVVQEDPTGNGEGLTWLGSGPCSLPGPAFDVGVCTTGPTTFTATETATLSAPATSEFADNEDGPAGACVLAPPPTNTPVPPTATNTSAASATPTRTATPTVTNTPTITLTPTVTNTPLPPTNTPVPPTATNTPLPPTNTPATPLPEKDCGDVNDDGDVNSVDSALILQLEAGLINSLVNAGSADVNDNGEVNSVDSALILQKEAAVIPQSALNCG